jgi:hypothetical protein
VNESRSRRRFLSRLKSHSMLALLSFTFPMSAYAQPARSIKSVHLSIGQGEIHSIAFRVDSKPSVAIHGKSWLKLLCRKIFFRLNYSGRQRRKLRNFFPGTENLLPDLTLFKAQLAVFSEFPLNNPDSLRRS